MKIIPEAALAQHIAVLGKTGSGKTFAIKGIVENLLAAHKRVGVIDPTGAWWGLRASHNGKGPGFPILVLGGDHGDLPLPALGGGAVARLLAEQGVNLIADTSQLTVGERTRWFTDFGRELYRLNRAPLHLVIDEAHIFAPQGKVPDPDTGKMLHAANTIASGGRSRGIRLTMITQRPQKLHKDTLTCADTLIAMRVLAPHDRMAVEEWIKGCGDMAAGKEVLNSLAALKRGEGWAWYPEGGFLKRLTFPPITTFDSSATPTDGHVVTAPKGMADIDLTEIKAAMADAVKEAEANDPKLLRAELAKVKAELAKKSAAAPAPAVASKSQLNAEYTRGREDGFEAGRLKGRAEGWTVAQTENAEKITAALGHMRQGVTVLGDAFKVTQTRLKEAPAPERTKPVPAPPAYVRRSTPGIQMSADSGQLTPGRQKILDKLAWLESMGLYPAPKNTLAAVCEVSPTSGGYFNNLGALRSAGLIDYPQPGTAAFTDAGRAAANLVVDDGRSVYEHWLEIVDAPQRKILERLFALHPKAAHKDELAADIGVSPTSGGYFNNLGALRTLGAVDYPQRGYVALTKYVMP